MYTPNFVEVPEGGLRVLKEKKNGWIDIEWPPYVLMHTLMLLLYYTMLNFSIIDACEIFAFEIFYIYYLNIYSYN